VRIFLNRPFQRFAQKERISDAALCEAVSRAERGLVDADLGGGVIKQRIPRQNEGRSGGFRSVLLYRAAGKAFFVYGFAKNERENIGETELADLKDLAKLVLEYDDEQISTMLETERMREVVYDEQNIHE
jgi:hypothetical protein